MKEEKQAEKLEEVWLSLTPDRLSTKELIYRNGVFDTPVGKVLAVELVKKRGLIHLEDGETRVAGFYVANVECASGEIAPDRYWVRPILDENAKREIANSLQEQGLRGKIEFNAYDK